HSRLKNHRPHPPPPPRPPQNNRAEKNNQRAPPPSHLPPPSATPSSNSSLDSRRSDARIVENGFATSGGLSKSAKVVLASGSKTSAPPSRRYVVFDSSCASVKHCGPRPRAGH